VKVLISPAFPRSRVKLVFQMGLRWINLGCVGKYRGVPRSEPTTVAKFLKVRFEKDGAKMVAGRVDTKPDEAIP